jgi:uncharacterized protein (TIGR01777 family)
MNILITGGTGFIGQQFIKRFPDYDYTVLTRNPHRARSILGAVTALKLISSLDELSNLDDFNAVINLAGEPIVDKRWTDRQKAVIQASRWDTTRKLVALFNASSTPPAVLLSGSAIGIYGDHGAEEIDETTRVSQPDFSSELCQQWEQIAGEVAQKTRLVYLRTGIVLHPQFGALQRMILPFKLGLGGPIADGRHYFSWIHWQDMVDAMHYLLTHEQASGPFNMTAPVPVTNRTFTSALGKAVHRPTIFCVPGFALKTLMGESAELLLGSQRVIPKALVDAGYNFKYTNVQLALENLV